MPSYVPLLPDGYFDYPHSLGSLSGVGALDLGAALVAFEALPGRSVPRTRD